MQKISKAKAGEPQIPSDQNSNAGTDPGDEIRILKEKNRELERRLNMIEQKLNDHNEQFVEEFGEDFEENNEEEEEKKK
ncbi:MAG: hypothetical protein AABX01_08350 [Candidatus Micrarchaeota archaeon]